MRKVDDGKKEKKKRKEKRKKNGVFSGHYVIASRPPERRPTGTPHARANRLNEVRLKVRSTDQNMDPRNNSLTNTSIVILNN